jgi:ribosomal protein S18 acetylase RimI-like enzyme
MHRWCHQVHRFVLREFHPKDLTRDKKDFLKKLSDPEVIMLGGFYGKKIIAQATLYTHNSRKKIRHVGGWSIMIHPHFQHQGLGEILLTMIEDIAKKKGLKRLEAKYAELNKAAEELYLRKMGYQVEGCQKDSFLVDNSRYINEILIAKLL